MSSPAAILSPSGRPSRIDISWATPTKGKYWGCIDTKGDPLTICLDDICAVLRNGATGKFCIILRGAAYAPDIQDADAYRLMRDRLGWTSSSPLAS